jgi:hypothetical protein
MRELSERLRGRIIGFMIHRRERLTNKELAAQQVVRAKFPIPERKTKKPVIVALIGLVGSGKSSVAHELASLIGATVIEGDAIRIELRKQSAPYERARAIAENAVLEIVEKGGNVILDSDFIDPNKRASLREKARKAGAAVHFLCVYTEDLDVQFGRVITADFENNVDDFFGGAKTNWSGSAQSKGAVVKLREMLRRLPQHYRWVNQGGGKWQIKNPPCVVLADIDTTDPDTWPREVAKCASKLISM